MQAARPADALEINRWFVGSTAPGAGSPRPAETGQLLWFSKVRNMGFIRPDGHDADADDLFVHVSGFAGKVPGPGRAVTFERSQNRRKPVAVNVRARAELQSSIRLQCAHMRQF